MSLSLAAHYDVRDDLRRDTRRLANPGGAAFTVFTLAPELAYGLPGRALLRLRAPVHWKEFEEAGPGSRIRKQGLGDLELVAGYDLVRATGLPGRRWDVAASGGVAIPTGTHEPQPFVGDAAPTPLQLGGGTWDPILGVGVRYHVNGAWALDATGAARLALMENADDYRPPTVFEAGLGGGARLMAGRLALGLHGEWSHLTHVEVAGVAVPNTGRDALYLAPAVSLRLNEDLGIGLTGRVSLYLRVNETQLGEDVLLAAALVYRTRPRWGGRS